MNQGLTEQMIANDFLISAKAAVKSYAHAITECFSKEIRNILKKQLEDAIFMHEAIANYMISNGYYANNDINEQITIDVNNAERLLKTQA